MNKVDLSKYNNSWYKPGPLVYRILWLIFGRVFVNTYLPWPVKLKLAVLKIFGAKVGSNIMLKPKVNIKYPWFLEIGNNAWIGECVWIDNLDLVIIEANCCISQGALLLTGNHDYKKTTFDLIVGKITIKEGAWIGANTLVTQNVICESHSVLGAGSVLHTNLPANEIWSGNPAKFMRNRNIMQ